MGIKKILGIQSQGEKIKEYKELLASLDKVSEEANVLSEDFELHKSSISDFNEGDEEIRNSKMKRFQAFLSNHSKEVARLCNKKTSLEKSIKKLEKDEELASVFTKYKSIRDFRKKYKAGEISKSILFQFMKSVEGGPVKYADVIIFNDKGQFLILQRAIGTRSSDSKWCIPGGHVDPGEEFQEAAVRELFEETGIKKEQTELHVVASYKNEDADIRYFMTSLTPEESTLVLVDSEEEIGSQWIEPKDINKYQFIFDMKQNLERILGLDSSCDTMVLPILKAFQNGEISEKVFKAFCEGHKEDIRKANNKTYFSHEERKDLAEKGEAMPDGKYPIRNRQDLKDAIRLVGSSDTPEEKVKAWIRKRAKELDLESELPESWPPKKQDIEKSWGRDKKITVLCSDPDNTLEELLKKIKEIGNGGHSFEIILDPEMSKANGGNIKLYWDGDGSDYISNIKIENNQVEKSTSLESTEGLRKESLDDETKDTKDENPDAELAREVQEDEVEKSELPNGFGVYVNFNDMEEASLFKSLVEEWKTNGKLEHVEDVLEKGFDDDSSKEEKEEVEKSENSEVKELFKNFLNFIEGVKTRLKNVHWTEENNSKHGYLDDLSEDVSEFEDQIAEAGQAGFGRFKDEEIKGEEIKESDPVKLCDLIFDKTTEFRENLNSKDDYNGEISWIDDFLALLKQTKYRLQLK